MKQLILDIGSYALKVGFGGEFAPRLDIPLVMGQIRDDIDFMTKKRIFRDLKFKDVKQEFFLGQEAFYLRNYLNLKWLYDGKTIADEYFFGKLLESAMNELKVSPANQTIVITQPFHSNIINQFGEIFFSKYNVRELVPSFQPLLNCMASNVHTGLVVDIGHQLTQITPIINGTILVDGVRVVELGGKDVTDLLHQLLWDRRAFSGLQDSMNVSTLAIAEIIKETYSHVSRDPVTAMEDLRKSGGITKVPLLQGEFTSVGAERFLAPEVLFGPQEKNVEPLDQLVYQIVSNYDSTIQRALLGNILLTGGTSLLPGLAERLYEELVRLFSDYDYKIEINPFAKYGSPRYSVFFGAAKFAAIEISRSMKISKVDIDRGKALHIPVALLEQFNAIFDQTRSVQLNQIIIGVQNLHNSHLYRQLYNIVNSQQTTSVTELGNQLERSPLEIYQMIDTLRSYDIIQGEFEGYDFINSRFQEVQEEIPVQAVQDDGFSPVEISPRTAVEAEPYIPSFQRLDAQMPDYVPEELKASMAEEEGYVPSFQRLDAQMRDQVPTREAEASGAEPQYEYTFQKIDDQMKEQWAKDSAILAKKVESTPRARVIQEEGFTFERIDKEKATEWEQDPTIITESKVLPRRRLVEEPAGFTFEKIDQEMADKWAREGVVSTPKIVEPKGFFDQIAIPVKEETAAPTFEKIEKEKAAEWATDETIVTGEIPSARDRLKELIAAVPSHIQAEEEKEAKIKEPGLILVPKKSRPRGFFEQPAPAAKPAEELPTFLKIKDHEIPKPHKTIIADLLKPKTEVARPAAPTQSKLPTFLAGQDLTEEQLRQLRAAEEEEHRRKEKEEKLL